MKKLLPIVLLVFVGCVANKQYRLGSKSIITVPSPGAPASTSDGCQPKPGAPCVAFLEFDDFGEMFEPAQLDSAVKLIESASTPDKHPVVVTFVHGWKNNADPKRDEQKDGNSYGFQQALLPLAKKYPNTPVIGVYVAWRGELVSKYWPLRRQFTYFNREAAATRIPGARMTNALARIVRATHNVSGYAILVGHSFGGLVLERALTQATVNQIQASSSNTTCEQVAALNGGTPGLQAAINADLRSSADLTVFVNSAAAATEAKQMLDVLKEYKLCGPAPSSPRNPDTALFISISSVSDAATKLALPIGHGYPFLKYKLTGSLRADDPLAQSDEHISQGSFYMSSAAHMSILQSHQVVSVDASNCKSAMRTTQSSDPELAKSTWQYFSLPDTGKCFKIDEKKGAWNTTPYWLMEVPSEIIPDHSTIFTGRFIAMLQNLVPTNEQVEASAPPAKVLTKAQ
jgi:hypothetical protein